MDAYEKKMAEVESEQIAEMWNRAVEMGDDDWEPDYMDYKPDIEDEEDDDDYDSDYDLECGFDPYLGCYSDDC